MAKIKRCSFFLPHSVETEQNLVLVMALKLVIVRRFYYGRNKTSFGLLLVTAETMVWFRHEPKLLLLLHCRWVVQLGRC